MKNRRPTRTFVIAAVLGLALMSLAPLAVQARGRHGQPPSPERAVERLTQQLDLSDEQQGKVHAILEESFTQRHELRDQHRQEMEAMRDATEDQLSAVLTGEQMDELLEMREERRERGRGADCRKGRWNDDAMKED
jgi:Spy/CpxP family protein refolding chaperone